MLQTGDQIRAGSKSEARASTSGRGATAAATPLPDRLASGLRGLPALYTGLPKQMLRNGLEHSCQMFFR